LPADLLAKDSPWVCMGDAIGHQHDFGGRSVFTVYFRWPGEGSRTKMLEYLNESRGAIYGPKPSEYASYMTSAPGKYVVPPVGMQAALLRQMIVINDKGELVPTRIVEMLQLRIFRGVPLPKPGARMDSQSTFEFEMRRALLFGGTAGGLHAREAGERDFSVQFQNHGADEIETFEHAETPQPAEPRKNPVLQSCLGCHSPHENNDFGLISFKFNNAPRNFYQSAVDTGLEREALLPENVVVGAVQFKKRQYEWGIWHGLQMGQREGR
jgi:hypothetical protein